MGRLASLPRNMRLEEPARKLVFRRDRSRGPQRRCP